MGYGLNLQALPKYLFSSHKYFQPGERHTRRRCGEDVLILMMEGTLYFTEDGIPTEVHPGEYCIQRRGLFQESEIPSDGAVYYYIHFLGEYCDNPDALPLRGIWQRSEETERIARLDFLQSTGGTEVETMAEFLSILSHLRRGEKESEHRRIVRELTASISEDPRHDWSLTELSSRSGYSVNHLIQLFRRETGRAPYAYITELRLQAARNLLMNSDLPVTHIAEECGFSSYVNFYKAFVRACSCTPQEWRRQCRGRAENDGRE